MEKATFEELKLIPGVTSEFVVKAQEQGWTLDQAQSAWMEQQAREKAAAEARARELEEQLAAAKSKPGLGLEKGLGVQKGSSSEDAPGGFEDPVAEFDARVRAKMASGAGRMKAIAAVSKADPALHQAYLLATQPNRASRRLVEDRGEEAGIV